MELHNIDIIYPRVVESSDWLELDKYRELEGGLGVFIFSNFFFQVKYVGRSGSCGVVEGIAEAIKNGKSAGSSRVKVIYTKSENRAISLEKKLINRYNPINNSR